jgi:hypothetical protein
VGDGARARVRTWRARSGFWWRVARCGRDVVGGGIRGAARGWHGWTTECAQCRLTRVDGGRDAIGGRDRRKRAGARVLGWHGECACER